MVKATTKWHSHGNTHYKVYSMLPFCFPVGQQHFDEADDIELKGLYDEKDGQDGEVAELELEGADLLYSVVNDCF